MLSRIRLNSDAGSQYTAIHYGETLMLEGLIPSIGTVGDALDNALCETTIGLLRLVKWFGPTDLHEFWPRALVFGP